MEIPGPLDNLSQLIYQCYERAADRPPRPHLGASVAGHECSRHLWLHFRWAESPYFDGRMLRLFESGHLEEARIIGNLRDAGIEVHDLDEHGKQWRVSFAGGHGGGSLDGVVTGVPGREKQWLVLECKTMNEKHFNLLVSKGVKESKHTHYVQMQIYMLLSDLNRALYVVVNKNTDHLYTEIVKLDKQFAEKLVDNLNSIIFMPEPPPRISERPDWWLCKFCNYRQQCHGTSAPEVNCRTCAHSTPEENGKWTCAIHEKELSYDDQVAGCVDHRFIPSTIMWAEQVEVEGRDVIYRSNGSEWANGDSGYSSLEIRAAADKKALGNAEIDQIREKFNGHITG